MWGPKTPNPISLLPLSNPKFVFFPKFKKISTRKSEFSLVLYHILVLDRNINLHKFQNPTLYPFPSEKNLKKLAFETKNYLFPKAIVTSSLCHCCVLSLLMISHPSSSILFSPISFIYGLVSSLGQTWGLSIQPTIANQTTSLALPKANMSSPLLISSLKFIDFWCTSWTHRPWDLTSLIASQLKLDDQLIFEFEIPYLIVRWNLL